MYLIASKTHNMLCSLMVKHYPLRISLQRSPQPFVLVAEVLPRFRGYLPVCLQVGNMGAGGDFITHASTLESYRDIWISDLFENQSPEQWAGGKKQRLKDKVRQRLNDLMAGYDFSIDEKVKGELDEIYEFAVKALT